MNRHCVAKSTALFLFVRQEIKQNFQNISLDFHFFILKVLNMKFTLNVSSEYFLETNHYHFRVCSVCVSVFF